MEIKKLKIAIVNSSSFGKIFPEQLNRLRKIGEVRQFTFESDIDGRTLAEQLQGYGMIIASVTPFFTKEFFAYKDELLLITRHGIGYNNIDLEAAQAHQTIVSIDRRKLFADTIKKCFLKAGFFSGGGKDEEVIFL